MTIKVLAPLPHAHGFEFGQVCMQTCTCMHKYTHMYDFKNKNDMWLQLLDATWSDFRKKN